MLTEKDLIASELYMKLMPLIYRSQINIAQARYTLGKLLNK